MKYLTLFLKENKGKVILSLLLLLGQVIGTLLIPSLIADVVDHGILQGDMDMIISLGIKMLIVALIATLISVWGSFTTSDLSSLFGKKMRSRLLKKSQALSLQQFDDIGISSMITRTTSDITNLQQTMGMVLQMVAPAPIIIIISILMTAMIHPVIAWIQVVFLGLMILFGIFLLKKSNRLSSTIQALLDRINKVVRETITGVRVIRAFGNEQFEEQRSQKAYEKYADHMIRLNKMFAITSPVVWMFMGILMCVILGLGSAFTFEGTMAIGEITAVMEYATLTMAYLMMAVTTMTLLPKARACMMRLQEVLDYEVNSLDEASVHEQGSQSNFVVDFHKVTFTYPGAEEPVLHNLNFSMKKGQTTAIIGSTGSGKSTLVDIFLRLHDIQVGQIHLHGKNIQSFTQEELRERIACVPQKAFLFSGSIAENLRMGKKDASDEELWKALRIAQAEDFVKHLPRQLDAPVAQGGTNFSGGQRQRLAIARALVKNADVFVFDDSFSALDVKTDALLREALRIHVTEPAKLLIAQRVSTIMEADQILVLEEGQVVGIGTHQELIISCDVYRAIVESQMKRKEDLENEKA